MRLRVGLLAVLVWTGSLLGVAAIQSAPAQAAPSHVAVNVNGRSTCISWTSGMTGTSALRAAGYQLTFRNDGIVTWVGAPPNPVPITDETHYWSYWHNTGGGWIYSSRGPSTYSVAAGTAEGWSYVDGSSSASAPGGSSSYDAICAGYDVIAQPAPPPAPAPAPVPATTSAATPAAGGGSNAGSGGGASTRPAVTPGATDQPATTDPTVTTSDPSQATASTPSTTSAVGGNTSSTGTSPSGSISPVAAESQRASSSNGAVLPTIIAIALVVLLGAAGFWQFRRRKQQEL